MALTLVAIPADTDILCEQCGYTLNGLPETGNCPECGKPIAESTTRSGRHLSAWEAAAKLSLFLFLRTAAGVIASPSKFFRGLSLGGNPKRGRTFSRLCHALTAFIFAIGFITHLQFMTGMSLTFPVDRYASTEHLVNWRVVLPITSLLVGGAGFIYAALRLIGKLIVILTSFEARYWGYRLPGPVVTRGLQYQSATYLPATALAVAWIIIGRISIERDPGGALTPLVYLYILCGTVVVSAVYLFVTYATAMRKLMYANRERSHDARIPPAIDAA